jgi:hypothetical protein
MKIGYARVSIKDQTVAMQVDALEEGRLHEGSHRGYERRSQ